MKAIYLSAVLSLAFASSPRLEPQPWLARVALGQNHDIATVARLGIQPVAELDRCCLVNATDTELDRLEAAGLLVQPLERLVRDGVYLFVTPAPWFDRTQLSVFGRVLLEDRDGVLLGTDESAIQGLNRLPVELARIPSEPVTGAQEPTPPRPFAVPESLLLELVGRVDQDSVKSHIQRLQNFYTRYSTTDSLRRAMDWVRNKFVQYGCDSTALETFRSNYAPNAIGVKRGRDNPRPIYVICGHTDATSEQQPTRAPGSDDNASGTSAVIEACRVFQGTEFANTVYFIGFSGEEQGLIGSDSFVGRAYRRGDSIKAALNFDMISYGRENIDTLEVMGKRSNPNCEWLVDFYRAQADTFSELKTRKYMTNSAPSSDHHSFWQRGYPALCGNENDFTPCYHTIGDTIGPLYFRYCGTNNAPMATEAVRAAVATLAKLAGVRTPTGIEQQPLPTPPAQLLACSPSVGRAPIRLQVLASGGTHRILVFDIAGRCVKTLAPTAGGEVIWDGTTATGCRAGAGIYVFQLHDRGARSAFKVVISDR